MAQGDNFCLRFNSFDNSVRTFWQGFQVETDFCDITLACEDKQIKTHIEFPLKATKLII